MRVGLVRQALEGLHVRSCGWNLVGQVLAELDAASSSLSGLFRVFFVGVSRRVIGMSTFTTGTGN